MYPNKRNTFKLLWLNPVFCHFLCKMVYVDMENLYTVEPIFVLLFLPLFKVIIDLLFDFPNIFISCFNFYSVNNHAETSKDDQRYLRFVLI